MAIHRSLVQIRLEGLFFYSYSLDHKTYEQHNCQEGYTKVNLYTRSKICNFLPDGLFCIQDMKVPVCPLCNQPVPVSRGEDPNIKVNERGCG